MHVDPKGDPYAPPVPALFLLKRQVGENATMLLDTVCCEVLILFD